MIKKLLIYLVKILFLFLILYFTFIEPTFLTLIYYVVPLLYILLYLILLIIISKLFEPKTKSNIFIEYISKSLLLIIGIGILFISLIIINNISDKFKMNYINKFIESADEIIYYNENDRYYGSNEYPLITHDNYTTDTILIDYDTYKIAFLYKNTKEFKEFKLEKKKINIDNIQIQFELKNNNKLLTLYPDNSVHRTKAIILIKNNEMYSVSNLKEKKTNYYYFLGLK